MKQFPPAAEEIGYGNARFGWDEEITLADSDDCREGEWAAYDSRRVSHAPILDRLLLPERRKAAEFPSAVEVVRVEVRRIGLDRTREPANFEETNDYLMGDVPQAPLFVITDPDRIADILGVLHRHSDGWSAIPWTPGPARVYALFYDVGGEYLGGVGLGGYGLLQGRVSQDEPGGYFKDVPKDDFRRLKVLLGLCPETVHESAPVATSHE